MKKTVLLLTTVILVGILFSTIACAIEPPLRVVVNGKEIKFPDAKPFIDGSGRIQTPTRFIAEELGAAVTWNGNEQKAEFVLGNKKLTLHIGKKEYNLDGQKKQMDTVALLKDERTFVPTRYIAEAFGAAVSWDSAIRTVYVDMPKVVDTGDTRNVVGFVVPKGIELGVTEVNGDLNCEAHFLVSFLRRNVEKQKDDMEKILLQKLDEDTVRQIMSRVRSKKEATDVLKGEYFYDSKTGQYLYLANSGASRYSTIELWLFKKGINPTRN